MCVCVRVCARACTILFLQPCLCPMPNTYSWIPHVFCLPLTVRSGYFFCTESDAEPAASTDRKRGASPGWSWGSRPGEIKRSPSPDGFGASVNYGSRNGLGASVTYERKFGPNHGLSANVNYGQNSGLGAGLSYGLRFRKRSASPDWTWGPSQLQVKRSPSPGDWKASANYGNGGWKASATYSWRKRSASPDWTITWKSG